MRKLPLTLILALAAIALAGMPGSASGSGDTSLPRQSQTLTPEQEAVQLYNDGISYRDKASELDKEAAAEPDATKKEKIEKKSLDRTESSIKKFVQATQKDPRLFQAWGSLGYAYRRTGKLAESLEAYNKAVETKNDEQFKRPDMPRPVKTPKFYAIEIAPGVHYTMGGLKINPETQVINKEGKPIPGFFAAGEVTGGVHGANRLGGNSISETITFGRIAGANAAKLAKQ